MVSAFDYFEPFGITGWYYEPLICIIDPSPEFRYYSIHAVKLWENAFNKHGIYNYNYRIAILDEAENKCDVTVNFVDRNKVLTRSHGQTDVGHTTCLETGNVFHINELIRKGARGCSIYVNTDYEGGKRLYVTVVHEVGHTLGIGHRLPDQVESFPFLVMTKDIMNPHLQQKPTITEESYLALNYFYNNSGWNGLTDKGNYIVQHPPIR